MGTGGCPVIVQAHVDVTGKRAWCAGGRGIRRTTNLPPALAAVVVLMAHHKTGLLHQRPDPAQAVVAVVRVALQAVADQEALGRTMVHVDAEDVVPPCHLPLASLLAQGVSPVFIHAIKALCRNQRGGMTLGVLMNRLVPVTAHQIVTALLMQPLEGPLVMPAEVVDADHVAVAMSSIC